jgi:lysophospholipase L1-like esterase
VLPDFGLVHEHGAGRIEALGWLAPEVKGFGGRGYTTSSGATRPRYVDNIGWYVVGASYRVVVIAGGNNDARASFSPTAFRAAVRSTSAHLRRAPPDATLVVLGPYSPSGVGYVGQRTIEREEAARIGVPFIDGVAQGWFKDRPDPISRDRFHPNDAG